MKLKYYKLLSNVPFKFNLRRYTTVMDGAVVEKGAMVGRGSRVTRYDPIPIWETIWEIDIGDRTSMRHR